MIRLKSSLKSRFKKLVASSVVSGLFIPAISICMLAISVCALAGSVSNPVPDTGQTQSYTNTFGEDSDYTINPHSYTDLGDTVKDNVTGLIWKKATAGPMNWEAAVSYCQGLGSGWRLPTVKELSFLVDRGRYSPAINTSYFPDTKSSYYWSSTTYAGYTVVAWRVYFYGGDVHGGHKSSTDYVRAVRGGQ